MDDRIYHKSKSSGSAWASVWDSPGGLTKNTPAIAPVGLGVLVGGEDGTVYYTTLQGGTWSVWTPLFGVTTPFVPILATVT
jgi:hypothetical protein